jgi:hypothetical protein
MAKKPQAPENIEKQFNKALFKTGEPVYFTWLGAKKYGHVTNHKQTNWGIQYTVTSDSTRYPCGIQIKEYGTQYTTGCIFFEETRSIGATELNRRIAAGEQPRSNLQIYEKPERPTPPSRNDDSNKRNVNITIGSLASFTMANMELIGESINSSATDDLVLTLNYQGFI